MAHSGGAGPSLIPLWAWSLWTSEPPLAVLASLPSMLVSEPAMLTMLPSESVNVWSEPSSLPSMLPSDPAMLAMLTSEPALLTMRPSELALLSIPTML